MKKFEKIVKDIAQHVGLTPDERALMKSNLEEYMAFKPVRSKQVTQHVRVVATSWSYRVVGAFLVVALLFTSGVGVTYASVDALPGDYLYGVKEVHEEVRTTLITDEEKKAEWLIERAHRRLEEAQLLAQKGLLNDETASLVEERFIKHTNRVRTRIETLREKRPALAEALELHFETGAEAHVETLETEEDTNNDAMEESAIAADEVMPFAVAPTAMRAEKAVRSVPKKHRHRIARLVRTHIGLPTPRHLEDGAAVMSASVPETAANAIPVEPEVAEELVKVLTTQQQRLEDKVESLPEEKKERLKEVLKEVREQREDIVNDIEEGDYKEARDKLHDAIKATHKTRSEVRTGRDIRPVLSPEKREELKERIQEIREGGPKVRPLPSRTQQEVHNEPSRVDRQ